MLQNFNLSERNQQDFSNPLNNKISVKLRMPSCYLGKAVPTSIVVMELLWQQYGLDLLHPQVSQWLERNAPDVKYAAARGRFVGAGNDSQFKVGPDGTVELHLTLKSDDRLREISSQYLLSQLQHSIEPEAELQLAA